jgi:hypothetical protein
MRLPGSLFTTQTLGRRDLSGCFLVHICMFYSSYSSLFAFLCPSHQIFRAKTEPNMIKFHAINGQYLSIASFNSGLIASSSKSPFFLTSTM